MYRAKDANLQAFVAMLKDTNCVARRRGRQQRGRFAHSARGCESVAAQRAAAPRALTTAVDDPAPPTEMAPLVKAAPADVHAVSRQLLDWPAVCRCAQTPGRRLCPTGCTYSDAGRSSAHGTTRRAAICIGNACCHGVPHSRTIARRCHACRQVACFCGTPAAAAHCLASRLEVADTVARCRRLQQETAEAAALGLEVHGFDEVDACLAPLRGAGSAVAAGAAIALHPLQLAALAAALQRALRLRAAVLDAGGGPPEALAVHAERIPQRLQGTVDAVAAAVDVQTGAIRDDGSPELAAARGGLRECTRELQDVIDFWCQELYRQGASTIRTAVLRRNRQCCSVKGGRSGVRRRRPSCAATARPLRGRAVTRAARRCCQRAASLSISPALARRSTWSPSPPWTSTTASARSRARWSARSSACWRARARTCLRRCQTSRARCRACKAWTSRARARGTRGTALGALLCP